MNSKIVEAIHSRTVWTVIIMCAYNILAVYGNGLSPQISSLINMVLVLIAGYFHVNTPNSQTPPAAVTPPPANQ